jgi:peroxiredoxin
MRFKILSILFLSIFAGFSLSAQLLNNVTVTGTIKNGDFVKKVYLAELSGNTLTPLDSNTVRADNSFTLEANIKKANFFQLTTGGQTYTILILQPGENVSLDIDANDMLNPRNVKGSPETIKVYEMLGVMNSYKNQQDVLNSQYEKVHGTPAQDSVEPLLVEKYRKLEQMKTNYLKSEISNSPSLASLLFIDQIPIEDNLDLYAKVDKVVYKKYPDNAFVGDLHRKVASKMKLAEGQPAPEINLPSPSGEYIKLSSLKGKVVLIDFWASWCSPCRRENPNVVRLYNKYNKNGFEIYGVSLDKEKSKWVQAIDADKLTWTHVSDLRYWNSVAAKDYGVSGIPFTVLLDKDGKVIATGLRGASLESKLKEIFGY